jgi:uncharacterized membrane protein
MNETRSRSWAKSIVWRVIGIALMPYVILGVGNVVGNDIAKIALWSTVFFHSVRVVLYYIHERIWLKVKWGTVSPPSVSL